ncbi:MAG: LytR family transcriptional regulator [Ruminococcaceae bacterium]|jgi:LCP family protein required for cell wall assembly|nr:LytR family transcriptional regulator [Oscillospiraceae bacterium]
MSKGKRVQKKKGGGFLGVLLMLLLVGGGLYASWRILVPEPATATSAMSASTDEPSKNAGESDLAEQPPAEADGYARKRHCWTFLLVGMDKVGSNTDSLILVRYDVGEQTVSLASIPRDTCVDVKRKLKKINAAYANGGMEQLETEVSRTFGIPIDFYVRVNVKGFVALVDELGGVDFDVPCNMSYDDPAQGLSIHFQKGMQHLSGQQALEVCRFRKNNDGSGYTDTGRMETQRKMLTVIAKKLLSWGNITKLKSYISIAAEHVDTDLSLSDMAWFAEHALGFDMEREGSLNTMMAPAAWRNPYMYLDPDATLEMVNQYLNPYTKDLLPEHLDIIS